MLTYSFSDRGGESLYEYLYRRIQEDILKGGLAPKERLPSKRSLAKHLGISIITVENAYAQLMAEGYIYSIPKKGYYVSNISKGSAKAACFGADSVLEPKPEAKEGYFADFSSSQTHPDTFPFSIWAKLMREVMAGDSMALMERPPSGGILPLRREIARYLKQFRGMEVAPDQIVVGAGTEYLYGLLIQLLGHDRIYAVENPGYQKVAAIIRSNHAACQHIPLDGQGLRTDCLEASGAEIVHSSPSHHFPTGIIMPIGRRCQLLGWASQKESRYIIEDDYDCEFRFMGKPIPALQSIDSTGKVIYMNTFSKTLASTIRISYMVLPGHLAERFYREMGFYSCTVSNFEQYTLTRFLQDGHFERHINRMRNYYHNQRDLLLGYLKGSSLASRMLITEENAGLHFLMQVDTPASHDVIMQRAKEQGIRLSSLSQYYEDGCPGKENVFLINYSAIHPQHMQEAAERLCQVFEQGNA